MTPAVGYHGGVLPKQPPFGLPFGNCHLDVLGSGSEEDVILPMRYYADDAERARWMKSFPDFPMPPRDATPYDRDRLLPKAEY